MVETKYRIVMKGYGKSKFAKVEEVRGKQIEKLESQGVELFSSKPQANQEAMEKTKQEDREMIK